MKSALPAGIRLWQSPFPGEQAFLMEKALECN